MRAARIARRPFAGIGRWPIAFAAALLLLIGLEWWTDGPGDNRADRVPTSAAADTVRPIPHPRDFATAIAAVERGLETARERAERDRGWLAQEMLARALIDRAQLTGSVDDYAAAEAALRRGFAAAPAGSGPHLLQAVLDLAMHRLDRAEDQLDRVGRYALPPTPGEQAEIEKMRGDIAFYRGGYAQALNHYDRADGLQPGAADYRRIVWHTYVGDPEAALAWIDRAQRRDGRPSVRLAAWLELQRGIVALERGNVRRASAHFGRADSLFPGYWLIEEHVAETAMLSGRLDEAERRYRELVERTEFPEFMEKLAALALRQGKREDARAWMRRAAGTWRSRLRAFPEATYAQAAEHCLAARRPGCALDLARRNHAARPYGEAKALLAEAELRAGRREVARRHLAGATASGWRSARMRRLALELESDISGDDRPSGQRMAE